jgi:predicted protein tyrosine phosphatase
VTLSVPDRFVPFDITVCGIDELSVMRDRGVTHILSLLDPGWPTPDVLAELGGRHRLDLRFHDVIDPGAGWRAPEPEDVELLLSFGRGLPARDAHLLVHCHMGISRSSAAMLLLLAQARPDRPAVDALAEVVRIRAHAWPNLRLVEIGDAMLDRRGELVAAAYARYREMVDRRPDLGRVMVQMGRRREVEGPSAH